MVQFHRVGVALCLGALAVCSFAQQGGGMVQRDDNSVRNLERALSSYLDGKEEKIIVTPGEFGDWPLTLKAGQVVIAEARSEAFDPALEIADASGKPLFKTDDRYPGDQRPLLLWRCEQEGKYSLRLRCFHDKSGGQAFVRFKVYDSMDLENDKMNEKNLPSTARFLFRIPLKAGQIKQMTFDTSRSPLVQPLLGQIIAPGGLPYISISRPIAPVFANVVMAPVDGDYYVVGEVYSDRAVTVRSATRELIPTDLKRENGKCSIKTPTNAPMIWSGVVKAGEFLEISTPELATNAQLIYCEEPDISQYDLSKPEKNPFFPPTPDSPKLPTEAFAGMPGRANDPRITKFVALRDVKVWIVTNGVGPKDQTYTLNVKPTAGDFVAGNKVTGKLRIGSYDYWTFDAKAGEVMSLYGTSTGFAPSFLMRNPDLREIEHINAGLDQTSYEWGMIVQRPGRYIVAVSCQGDGGGGEYSLQRKVFPPKEFAKGSPATGEIGGGQTQVWKFTAKPGEPLYIKWWSSKRDYSISVRNENGDDAYLPLTAIDNETSYGIINVSQPTTYLVVLASRGPGTKYSIELSDLPRYKKK